MMPQCSISSKNVPPFQVQSLNGLPQVAQTRRFKAWFLDKFGVLHDGKQPYRGAIATSLGRSCIHLTWKDRAAISRALGTPFGDARAMSLQDLERILELFASKRIPMVVANPDYVAVETRDLCLMPGTLAAKHEELNGEVKWMGKPGKIIYESAIAMISADVSDCIAVGDSLHHDIKGANAAGIKSVFITGGIHATELRHDKYGEVPDLLSVQSLAMKHNALPS